MLKEQRRGGLLGLLVGPFLQGHECLAGEAECVLVQVDLGCKVRIWEWVRQRFQKIDLTQALIPGSPSVLTQKASGPDGWMCTVAITPWQTACYRLGVESRAGLSSTKERSIRLVLLLAAVLKSITFTR